MAERVFRVFVSSPSDVMAERNRVQVAADRLNGEFEGLARIEVLRWEDAFYTAAQSFQEAIDAAVGGMSGADMVVCIVWSRVGLKLNPAIWRRPDGTPYESGTVLEYETALAVSRKQEGAPDVYLFRKTAPVLYHADRCTEEMEQHQLLEAVWKKWTETGEGYNIAGYQTFAGVDDFEEKLEACLRLWLERHGVAVRGPVWDRHRLGSPFCGLAPFEASHAPVFFGREAAIERTIGKLRRSSFLLLIGSSGSGKSSLLRAGLLPRIVRPGVIPDIDLWRTALVLPAGDPLANLAETLFTDAALGNELRQGDFRTPQLLAGLLAAGGDHAIAPIRAALERAAQKRAVDMHYEEPRPARLLLAVDQVERLFVEAEPARVEAFAAVVRALVDHALAVVIVALRSDAYARFQKVDSFVALREGGAIQDLLPPVAHELEDVVTRPVAACHPPLAFETDVNERSLAEVLVEDAHGGDALPLLQMTLHRLFEAEAARGDGILRFADYPGMDEAVTQVAEEAFATLDPAARAALPALLTALVHDVDFDPATGRAAMTIVPVVRDRFERGQKARTALIDAFIARRLLTSEDSDGMVRVRPVHEALLRVWPEAVHIVTENSALIRVRHTLAPMVAEWSRADAAVKNDYLVTSAALLAGAAHLAARFGDDLAPDIRTFIADSLAADARRRNAERRRQRNILAATAAGLVVALVLAGLAGWQWRVATAQRQIAEVQRDRAEKALTAATRTANTLVIDLARQFRDRAGMPVDLVRTILERAQALQRQLLESGEMAPELRASEAVALDELVITLESQGDTKGALAAAERGRTIMAALAAAEPANPRWQRELSVAYNKIGNVLAEAGRGAEALDAYQKGLAIIQKLAATNPADAVWRRDMAISYQLIGDALVTSGRREESVEAYRKMLAITETLATAAPADARAQRDLSVCYNKLGDVLVVTGRREEALDNYRKGLAVIQKVAAADPRNTQTQRDISISHDRIGDMVAAAGRPKEALEEYRKALDIRHKLAAGDPGNAIWQRDLVVSHNKIGDMLMSLLQRDEAMDAYRKSLAIAEKLAAANPSSTELQRDVAIGYTKIGDASLAAGQKPDALAAYQKSLELRTKLAATDPGNATWQRDLTIAYDRVGNTLVVVGRIDEGLELFGKGLAIRQKLAAADPGSALWQRDLAVSYDRIGDTLNVAGRRDEAIEALRNGAAIIEKYAAADPGNVLWQMDLVLNLFKLAKLGDDAEARLNRALKIVRQLAAEGNLPANQAGWVTLIEQALATLRK